MEHRLRLTGDPPVRCVCRRLDCRARGDQPSAPGDARGAGDHVGVYRAAGGLTVGDQDASCRRAVGSARADRPTPPVGEQRERELGRRLPLGRPSKEKEASGPRAVVEFGLVVDRVSGCCGPEKKMIFSFF